MKKILLNKNWMMLIAAISVLLPSCLKDKDNEDRLNGPQNTEGQEWVSIPKGTKSTGNVLAIEAKSEPQDVNLFQVSYDFVTPAPSDFTTTLAVNNALVTDPNAIVLPTNAYTVPALDVAFTKGNRLSSMFKIVLNTDLLPDPTAVYGVGFTISSVSKAGVQIPSNLKNVLFYFTVKNKYDGEYEVTGTMVDAARADLTGYFPMKYHLITAGAKVVDGFDPVIWEDYFIPIRAGTALSGYGAFCPIFTFDANDKIVTVTNIYGQPAGNGRYAQVDPSGVNSWDPATKTIKVKFFMFQPAAVPLPDPRVRFDWTMTYKGPRP
jgi:hypothetical protein